MKNKQINNEVARMMNEGRGKTEIFGILVDRGARKKMAAHYIASYPDAPSVINIAAK
ncbi:MAG: hypothetical protein P8090_18315 [Gammaproteobacteria bacterium]